MTNTKSMCEVAHLNHSSVSDKHWAQDWKTKYEYTRITSDDKKKHTKFNQVGVLIDSGLIGIL